MKPANPAESNYAAHIPQVRVNYALYKRILDVVGSVTLILLLAPILLAIVLAVKLSSAGAVIYRQQRIGRYGRPFAFLKFRSMFQDADKRLAALLVEGNEKDGPIFKMRNDPRVTPVGKFLRKYSLDELLQLCNVLTRDMSLVGPRMIAPEEMEKYNQWGINLLTVKPGITGLWQVSGRSDVSYEERVRLDMYYVRNWTIWLDLQLLLETFPAVMKGQGAY